MNKTLKKKLIRKICNTIKMDALSRVDKMPEGWDGIELRYFIAEKANDFVFKNSRKKKDYDNVMMVTSGL